MSTIKQPDYEIQITIAQQYLTVDEEFLRGVVRRTLSLEQVSAAEISIALIGNEEIWDLNRRYLNHDYATDVLSFLLESQTSQPLDGGNPHFPPGRGTRICGEVIVSAEMAVERAAEFGWSAGDELLLYLVHGLLHLCGYDDQTDADRASMRGREREVLDTWDITPHYPQTNQRSMS